MKDQNQYSKHFPGDITKSSALEDKYPAVKNKNPAPPGLGLHQIFMIVKITQTWKKSTYRTSMS